MTSIRRSFLPRGASMALLLAACSAPPEAGNLEPVAEGTAYQAQYRAFEVSRAETALLRAPAMNAASCLPAAGDLGEAGSKVGPATPVALEGELLSRGDLVQLRLPEDETFSGEYVISRDGTLKLPYLAPVEAQGRSTDQVAREIRSALVAGDFYGAEPQLSLLLMDLAPVRVAVRGAVFEPHALDIGGVSGDTVDSRRQAALGASTEARNLSVALRSAGGVRPDADLSAVRLTRAGVSYTLDLRGIVEGRDAPDVVLVTGDEIFVPSRQCFQDALMTPSPISPPGISLYLSNLTQPASGNAPSAIGQTVRELPYGARYMQAVVDANCVGGARASSAARSAALFTRNPMTDVSAVIERPVEEMRQRADRDDYDPYLLPGDAIACYDSGVTNLTEVGRVLGVLGAVAVLGRD
ncbi:polysaccharide biosynthesis/export family protein [Oceanicola sp. S124]|uniref:polysaccharide biosynthesis/export family protein n=1 Tax=Oceanicola sp. S124 TaxID=1042378 RepID=UPI000255938C|nr:polysaccharide biosynthesis/export family protein [Oceanicola sp. S124]